MKKRKKQYPEDFKTTFGFSTMSWSYASGGIFISQFFMLFLTDYSGIDGFLNKVGAAAAIGTILLLIARIVDLVNDPVQSWLIDSSKPGRLGKYRKFNFISIILLTVSLISIFSIPDLVKSDMVFLCLWLGFFYLIYEFGLSFHTAVPLMQNITYDKRIRTKHAQYNRIWTVIILCPVYFLIPIITGIDQGIGNMSTTFTIVASGIMLFAGIGAFVGTTAIRENISEYEKKSNVEKIRLNEIIKMIKENKPLQVHIWASIVAGFVWGLITAISIYFIKWYYCADLSTGAVDSQKFSDIYSMYALSLLLPNIIAPFFAGWVMRKSGSAVKAIKACHLVIAGLCFLLFILIITGILQSNPIYFITMFFIMGLAFGLAVVPTILLWTECGDYAEYKTGRKMTAIVNSANSMIAKGQTAISQGVTGAILIFVGYSVDAKTGAYAGDLSALPTMITGFGIFISVIPTLLFIISWAIYQFFYPFNDDKQLEIANSLAARNDIEINK